MGLWPTVLVQLAVVVWLLQWISKKWRHRPLPLFVAHGISVLLNVFVTPLFATDAMLTYGQLASLTALLYVPGQLVVLSLDRWGMSHPTRFFRGLSGPQAAAPSVE